MLSTTEKASWRIFVSDYVLDEIEQVLTQYFGISTRFARLTRLRCSRRAVYVQESPSGHEVPYDLGDSPILRAGLVEGLHLCQGK
jgi:hypothetical protein